MMYLLISFIMIMTSIMFSKMINPLTLGLTLLLQTLNMCLMIGMISKSFWFSFILFLILLGGMLILFMYIISLAPNKKFSMPKNFYLINLIIIMMFSMLMINFDKMNILTTHMNNEMNSISNVLSYLNENSLSLSKLYNPPTFFITIMMINYLFMTLITTIYITKAFFGPLRTSIIKK